MERGDSPEQNPVSSNSAYNIGNRHSDAEDIQESSAWSDASSGLRARLSTRHVVNAERDSESSEGISLVHRPRSLPQRRATSASYIPASSSAEPLSGTTTFESPLRAIFVSGPPTASVSANTAHASLSASGNATSSGPLAALSNAGASRRFTLKSIDGSLASSAVLQNSTRAAIMSLEKDRDDPDPMNAYPSPDNNYTGSPSRPSKFIVSGENNSPRPLSRGYQRISQFAGITTNLNDTSTLTGHLFQNGFMEGRHSDITVFAFGNAYRLHKLLLDRVPYFSSAFSGAWAESSAKEMNLQPENIDTNITKVAFELALKRIYGTQFPIQEDQEAIGLFATACWLNIPELVESCVESILRQMRPSTLHELIQLVTKNYYGKAGDRILSSAKAMLCREGWEMQYACWDKIPAEIVREIVGGDPFFIPSEWERWFLAVKILNRRLRAKAIDHGLVTQSGEYLCSMSSKFRSIAVRLETTQTRGNMAENDRAWSVLYASPDIAPILTLLDQGIHYIHLRFEQLQQIRSHRDVLGVPILPEKVVSDALWMSMELRQKILNAHENDLEIGLTQEPDEPYEDAIEHSQDAAALAKGKQREDVSDDATSEMSFNSNSNDDNTMARKFWIPSNDVSCIMGGTREANVERMSANVQEWTGANARLSANMDSVEALYPSELFQDGIRPPHTPENTSPPRYSTLPPFRFSAEFPHPRTLKEKKRVYSQTVWYAGSMWNLYIQRVNTSKNQQLGIYLHRAKDSAPMEDPLAQVVPATVDDRIGQLEREMLLRKSERRNRQWRSENEGSPMNSPVTDFTLSREQYGTSSSNVDMASIYDSNPYSVHPETSERLQKTSAPPENSSNQTRNVKRSPMRVQDSGEEDEELFRTKQNYNIPAMPPYLDTRPVIKTYFKIYSPDRAGRLLSIYESAPEKFVVSKSWGWKSSQMVFDEGISGYDMARNSKDNKLRYMVVIGNV